LAAPSFANKNTADVIIRNAMIYDGSGSKPYKGELEIRDERISYVGPERADKQRAKKNIDAHGKAVSPGFINMLSHIEETVFVDGRALSDLKQGVTLEVLGEDSMGPLSAAMKKEMTAQQGDIKYPVSWTTLGEYLTTIEQKGIAPNVASFVGAGTVRNHVLGSVNVAPTAEQLQQMRALVRQGMEDGAMGLTTALIYVPNTFAQTPELIALAQESARCGGIYTAHMRSEGDRIEAAVDETIAIAKASDAPAEIFHLKFAGKDNWHKIDSIIKKIEDARAKGIRITADMYTYPAGATGLDAAMPPWVQEGGITAWVTRLKDPATREKVIAEMRNPHPKDWESLYGGAGADGTILLGFKTDKLKPLTGKTLAQVAKERGVSPEDAAIDLIIEDGSRIEIAYFLMDEKNLRTQVALPWVSFGSDGGGSAPEGVFLLSSDHPRTYGNFARVFAKYVREDKVISVEEAVRKLTSQPADNLSITDRGRLKKGAYADVVIFDPATIQDHATFAKPQQFATGVDYVIVNGKLALENGEPTGVPTGKIVRGRAWTGGGGACKKSAAEWGWVK
jgi:N-acyl-D-amino-acid deacylase